MNRKSLYAIAILAVIVLFQSSCKKEEEALACKLASWQTGSQGYMYTYNSQGFIERMSVSTSSSYVMYTQNGSILTRQAFDSTGAPIGSPVTAMVNSDGYYSMTFGSVDTSLFTYNADGQLLTYTRRNDTIVSRSLFTYENGDIVKAINLRSDSSVSSISTYEYYTDKVNRSNLNLFSDILDSRYGKPSRHFLKRTTTSNSSGDISYGNFYYTFDENGNAVSAQLINQPSNTINDIVFTYSCE